MVFCSSGSPTNDAGSHLPPASEEAARGVGETAALDEGQRQAARGRRRIN